MNENDEINYITFVLGYDLLNEKLSTSDMNECDNVYDFCNYLAKKFIESDNYKSTYQSTYENLKEWLIDNKDIIKSDYLYFSGIDNKHILEIGTRDTTKVALVEMEKKYGKEYIIAFHYEFDSKKLEWGYGYYYDNDFKKAKIDFERVKKGETLENTFKESKSKNSKTSVQNKKNKERER